jgi:Protein of unknown function (DUF3105)
VTGRYLWVLLVGLALAGCGGDDSGDEGSGDRPATNEAESALLAEGGEAPAQEVDDLDAAVQAAGCELQDTKPDSRDHVADIDARIDYETNPPTAGKHFGAAAEDGIYQEAPPDSTLVHSHEHGRIVIWFEPSLPEEARAGLRALVEEDDDKMLIVPRAGMPYDVAATAWNADPEPLGTGRLLACPDFGPEVYDALRTFRDEHRGKGPEPIP